MTSDAQRAFLQRYPEYPSTARIDELRASEYGYIDDEDQIYLDYAGAGLAARSQIRAHAERLTSAVFGNPHSVNPSSRAAGVLVESARRAVREFLRAAPEEYAVIFTPNSTGACRLVGEAYPFGPDRDLVLTLDNHNSVNGIREYARRAGARTRYVPVVAPELRIDTEAVRAALDGPGGLFAYPAQSNFTGVRHPLDWIELARDNGFQVLVDASAYVATNRLDLSVVHPDFVPLSWYKVFGYPTGLGCLVARWEALAQLRRPWFSGGTIEAVSAQGDWHTLMRDESAFEDGTLNFLNIPDVEYGLSWVEAIGMDVIGRRVRSLTGWLLDELIAMRHGNDNPLVRVYGPVGTEARGGTVAFNLLDPAGTPVDERLVAAESAAAGISLRTGCFCNPGAGESAFALSPAALAQAAPDVGGAGRRTLDDVLREMSLPTGGAVRVSLGLVSTFEDVRRFVEFVVRAYRDRDPDTTGLAPRLRC